ncbi:helix-turn-helix domain-containing protein [Streptosporangium sp. NBC_01755]|uniref:helix-turn-helix domain-containing protein n=1 Tax=unclassified Streptosporangium TaxID=2632669 RepID=UPI002DD7F073|nr:MULTISPECIES: helix-turn-helix domain-containing protein [unclassified Streptosporangium]WSA28303.1 helix-turn-helix domain-containing protein [Streptosporangium sp. NBC_01810]WSD00219.1 helix-turn-helix domain-containing protein [Streptosporangium sp. NBC_01755]
MHSPKARGSSGLGKRLRNIRMQRGLSLRELAKRAGCSASLISQVERDQTVPSAGVVYALANELDIPLGYLFGAGEGDSPGHSEFPQLLSAVQTAEQNHDRAPLNGHTAATTMSVGPELPPAVTSILQLGGSRHTIDLASGVRWERLTPQKDAQVDFLEVVYQPFGRSTDSRYPIRHDGREYQLVLEGVLHADIGFETYVLEAGDSLAFNPATPHQYRNMTDGIVRCVSVVVHYET